MGWMSFSGDVGSRGLYGASSGTPSWMRFSSDSVTPFRSTSLPESNVVSAPPWENVSAPSGAIGQVGSGIAQGLYGIGTAWNWLTGDEQEAQLYSNLASNIDSFSDLYPNDIDMADVARGIARTVTMAIPAIAAAAAGKVVGPAIGISAGIAGTAASTLTNLAIGLPNTMLDSEREAKAMGLDEESTQSFVRNSATIEGGLTLLFSAVPAFRGMEGIVSDAVEGVGKAIMKDVLKRGTAELAEEELITMFQFANRKAHALDPSKVTMEQLGQEMLMTGLQTIGTMGVLEAGVTGTTAYLDRGTTQEGVQPQGPYGPEPLRYGPEVPEGVAPPTQQPEFSKETFLTQESADEYYQKFTPQAEAYLESKASRKDFAKLTGMEDSPKSPIAEFTSEERKQFQGYLEAARGKKDKASQIKKRKEERHRELLQTGISEDDPAFQDFLNYEPGAHREVDAPAVLKEAGVEKLYGLDVTSGVELTTAVSGKTVKSVDDRKLNELFKMKGGRTIEGATQPYDDGTQRVAIAKSLLKDKEKVKRTLFHELGHVIANIKVNGENFMSALFGVKGEFPGLDRQITLMEQATEAAAAKLGYRPDERQLELFSEADPDVQDSKVAKFVKMRDDMFFRFKKKETHLKIRFSKAEYDQAKHLAILARPFDAARASKETIADRYSIHEVYADATSVFFWAPDLVAKHAPLVFQRISEGLAHKKSHLQKFFDIQAAAAGKSKELVKMQYEHLEKYRIDPGNAIRAQQLANVKAKRDYKFNWVDALRVAVSDRTAGATDQYQAKKIDAPTYIGRLRQRFDKWMAGEVGDIESEAQVKLGLESAFRAGAARAVIDYEPIHEGFVETGLPDTVIGEVLTGLVSRAHDEKPGGIEVMSGGRTAEASERIENELRKEWGDEKIDRVKELVKQRNDILFLKAARDLHEAGDFTAEQLKSIEDSGVWYSSQLSWEHFQKNAEVHGLVKEMEGELSEKVDPINGSLLKGIKMRTWAERRLVQNKAVVDKVNLEGLKVEFTTEKPGEDPGYNMEWVQENIPNEDGVKQRAWVALDKTSREAIYGSESTVINTMATRFNNKMYGVFYPLLVSMNLGYVIRQAAKDINRTLKVAPTMVKELTDEKFSKVKFLKNLPAASKLAYKAVFGKGKLPDQIVKAIYKGQIDPITNDYIQRKHMVEDESIDRQETVIEIMEQFGYKFGSPEHMAAVDAKLGRLEKAHRLINGLLNVQDITIKMAAAMEVDRALGEKMPSTNALIVQNWVGTPNRNQRTNNSAVFNALSFFSKIAITGTEADLRAFRSARSSAEYFKNWAQTAGWMKVGLYLMALGYFDELFEEMGIGGVKDIFDRIQKYEKEKKTAIPLPVSITDTDGEEKSAWLNLWPSDPMGNVLDSFALAVAKAFMEDSSMGNKPGFSDEMGEIFTAMFQATPMTTWNSVAQVGSAWFEFMRNENPTDEFTGSPIVTPDQRRLGTWESVKPMVRWTLSKGGIASDILRPALDATFGPLYPSVTENKATGWAEAAFKWIPGIEVGNRGLEEQFYRQSSLLRDESMWVRDRMDRTTQEMTVLMDRFRRRQDLGTITLEQKKKLAIYKTWYSEAYTPLSAQAKKLHEDGNDEEAMKVLDVLRQRSEQVRDGVELPDFAMRHVLWKLTDEPEEVRAASKNKAYRGLMKVEADAEKIEEENLLRGLAVAKRMPFMTAVNHLRTEYIMKMDEEQLAREARKRGIRGTGSKESIREALIQSHFRPEMTEGPGRPTAYGKRVRRLQELLAQ